MDHNFPLKLHCRCCLYLLCHILYNATNNMVSFCLRITLFDNDFFLWRTSTFSSYLSFIQSTKPIVIRAHIAYFVQKTDDGVPKMKKTKKHT